MATVDPWNFLLKGALPDNLALCSRKIMAHTNVLYILIFRAYEYGERTLLPLTSKVRKLS